ncbi:hypothetical protein L9F63_009519, partial [Diploptera punctata]
SSKFIPLLLDILVTIFHVSKQIYEQELCLKNTILPPPYIFKPNIMLFEIPLTDDLQEERADSNNSVKAMGVTTQVLMHHA